MIEWHYIVCEGSYGKWVEALKKTNKQKEITITTGVIFLKDDELPPLYLGAEPEKIKKL